MAIDFSRVNISLDQFQKMASGDYNAGEVSLKDSAALYGTDKAHLDKLQTKRDAALSKPSMDPLFSQALFKAVDEIGLDTLTAGGKRALLSDRLCTCGSVTHYVVAVNCKTGETNF